MTATAPGRIDHLRIERGRDDAFTGLTHEQRLRLIVQVLCGLVAYDEHPAVADETARASHDGRTDAPLAPTTGLTDRLAS